jgi:preprotein translocase subunit SecD
VNEDFITRLRGQLVDAAGRTQRRPVVSLAWLRPALVTAAVLLAVAVGVIALGGPAGDAPVAGGATVAFRVAGGDAAAAAAVLQDRLDAVALAGTVRADADEVVVDLAGEEAADRRTLDGLTRPGRLAMYDWEPNLVREEPLPREQADRLAERAEGRTVVEHEGGWWVLEDKPALTNRDLAGAEQVIDAGMGSGAPAVALTFTDDGKTAFEDLSRAVTRRGADLATPGAPAIANAQHFAIVVDGRVTALPYINHEENPDGIDGASGAQISGDFTLQEARELTAVLDSGALPGKLAPQ